MDTKHLISMNYIKYFLLVFILQALLACDKESETIESNTIESDSIAATDEPVTWKFIVVGDTHVTFDSDTISEMIPYFLEDSIDLILLCGDIVEGGKRTSANELETELEMWQAIFQPLYDEGIGIYPVRGNHEDDATDNILVWNSIFTGDKALPQNGPAGETNLSYSFNHKNALFVGLDTYVNIHKINQEWLDEKLDANNQPHIFAFGHEAAFKVFHDDCLDDFPTERDTFWKSLSDAGAKTYFCGHDHFFDAIEIDDGDGNAENNVYQCLVGGGGAWIMPKYRHNGDNASYILNPIYHRAKHGYALVEISGATLSDLDVTITWKERVVEGAKVMYLSTENVIQYQVPANGF